MALEGKSEGLQSAILLGNQTANQGQVRAVRLPHLPMVPSPGRPLPDPGIFFFDVVHLERNFTYPSVVFLLRCPPVCLSLQRELGVRWPRSSRAASETSCAVSASAQGASWTRPGAWGPRGQSRLLTCVFPSAESGAFAGNGLGRGGRAWQATDRRTPCTCPALLYGDAEKPGESGRSEPPRATSQKACACNQKPCSCPKADVNYEFLHATGKGASPALGAAVLWSQGSR